MKNNKIISSWFVFVVLLCTGISCKMVDRANKHYKYLEYTKAIPLYKKVLERDSADADSWAKLGDCYRMINQTSEAETCYEKAVSDPKTKDIYKLYYAQMLINNNHYEDAHKWIDDYIKVEPADTRAAAIDSGISHLDNLLADKNKFKVQKININTDESEYGPSLYKDGIVFTSSRESEPWANRSNSWTGKRYYSVYYSVGKETIFEKPTIFLKGVQTKYNNSSVCFNNNGTEMILTRNNIENGKVITSNDSVVKLKLFTSRFKDGLWSDVIPFQYNSNQYSCAHAALNSDGTKLYFSSDMPGTIGGMDLWVCSRTENGWSQPKNLGRNVNTEGNELFPTVAENGTLYFSSNGHDGLGGLDIYSTSDTSGTFSVPKNAGAPINSSDDDFGLIWDSKNKMGYFTSNRVHQGGNDDIFCLTRSAVNLVGLVYDKKTSRPLTKSKVRVIEEDTSIEVMKIQSDGKFKSEIRIDKNYKVVAEQNTYSSDSISIVASDIINSGDSVFVKIPLEKQGIQIAIEGNITNQINSKPIDSAQVVLINLTCNDTMTTIADHDGHYDFYDLAPDCRYRIMVDNGYCTSNSFDTSSIGVRKDRIIKINIGLFCLEEKIVLHNIYYDLNKYNIRPDAEVELNKLVDLLKKYPQIEIELGSHTDSRASYMYNMILSQKRAMAAVDFLVKRGIRRHRLTPRGYGESMPVNNCIDEGDERVYCTEEEYQLNRRTEIKILSWSGLTSKK